MSFSFLFLFKAIITMIKISSMYSAGARFTKTKSLISYSLTGTFPIKNSTSRENCDSRAW